MVSIIPFAEPSSRRRDANARDISSEYIWIVNKSFEWAPDYRPYVLVAESSEHNRRVSKITARWASRPQSQMRSRTLDAFNPISVINFLSSFNLECDINGMNDGAVMWLFHFLLKASSTAALNARFCFKPTTSCNTPSAKAERMRTYQKVEQYLFQIYATDYVIAENHAALKRYKKHRLCRQRITQKPW